MKRKKINTRTQAYMELAENLNKSLAEEYECTAGLECDTWFDSVKNCTKFEVLQYGENHPRNPDLDKYMYVLKGE